MRAVATAAVLMSLLPPLSWAGNKLSMEDRIELTRGLTAEYGTVKVLLPRSRKPLEFDAKAGYDKQQWAAIAKGRATLATLEQSGRWTPIPSQPGRTPDRRYLWTDDYSSIFSVAARSSAL